MAQQATLCSNSRLGWRCSRSRSLRENSIDPVYATRVIRDNPSRFLRLETLESQTTRPFFTRIDHVTRGFRPNLPVTTGIVNSGSHLVQLSLTERACRPRPPCRFSRSLAPPQPERRQSPNPADQLATANPRPDVVEVVPAPIHDVLPPEVVNGLLLRRQGQLVFVQQLHLHDEEPFLIRLDQPRESSLPFTWVIGRRNIRHSLTSLPCLAIHTYESSLAVEVSRSIRASCLCARSESGHQCRVVARLGNHGLVGLSGASISWELIRTL